MIRKFGDVSKEAKKKCIDEVIAWAQEIQSDEVGMLAAQELIDIVAQTLGPDIYNMGLRDAKKLLQERFFDLETEIDLLERNS